MTDRESFLRAIRATPDDDTPRHVFADWLDEHGEPVEAEFIRVQVELDPIRHRLEDLRTRQLILREEQIESQGMTRAFGAAAAFDDRLTYPQTIGYRRGLPDWAVVSLDTLLNRGEQLLSAFPTARELAVFGIEGRGAEMAACPLLARLDVLEVADTLTEADAAELAASPHTRSIRDFKLYGDWDYDSELGVRLAERGSRDWPARIEMVWLWDGVLAGIESATFDRPPDEDESYAYPVNVAAGRQLAFDVRPARQLFPLRGYPFDDGTDDAELRLGPDMGYGMYTGRLPDGTQALFAFGGEEGYLVTFEESGIVRRIERRDPPIAKADRREGQEIEDAAWRYVTEELRLTPAVLRVREFRGGDGFGVHLWPSSFDDYFDHTARPAHMPDHDWSNRGGVVSRWLRKQDFVIDWGNDYWADWRGTIHTS